MFFPFFSLAIYLTILGLISLGILPDISSLFVLSAGLDIWTLLALMGLVIFLESIIYLGFYLPGQFIAVILVISSVEKWQDIIPLTLVSIIAVTLSALVNYTLGSLWRDKNQSMTQVDYRKLILSMIHINTLALALFEAGKMRYPKWIIWIVGILNLPYYLLMIAVVYQFQDAARELGENPYYLLIALILWCGYSVLSLYRKNNT
jgi:membrane-associated protein